MLIASCAKDAEYDQTLGLFSKYNVLSAAGGQTDVAVFSNTDWTVKMDRECTWASIDRFSGHKSGRVIFNFDVNYGRSRRVILEFQAGGETRTINMFQSAGLENSEVVLKIGVNSITPAAAGETVELPFETNLIYDLDVLYLTITYPEGQQPSSDWITLSSVTKDKLVLKVAPNTTGEERVANLRVTHMSAGAYDDTEGDPYDSNVLSVVQPKE